MARARARARPSLPVAPALAQGASFGGLGSTPQLGANQNCFEIFGFDVLVDDDLRPWLLEAPPRSAQGLVSWPTCKGRDLERLLFCTGASR